MRILYFTEGTQPTTQDIANVNRLTSRGLQVFIRNAAFAVGINKEDFEGVSGSVPVGFEQYQYVTPFDVTYKASRYAGMLGDSRFGLSTFVAANGAAFYKSMGLISWLQSASYGALSIPETMNFGVAGENTSQILARTATAIASLKAAGADICFFIGGTNDYTASITDDQRKANVLAILKMVADNGLMPIVFAETPRRKTDPADYIERHWQYRLWMLNELPKLGYMVLDVWPYLASKENPKVVPDNSTYDGQHGDPTQQQQMGLYAWRQVAGIFGNRSILPINNADYNAAAAPGGSTTRNPMMLGTGGNKAANANATGQIANNWNLEGENMAGMTVTCSKEAHPLYGETQVIRITGKSTGAADKFPSLSFYQDPPTAPAVGEKYKVVGEIAWNSVYPNLFNCTANLLSFPKFFSKIDGDGYPGTVLPKLQPPKRSRETPVLSVDANTTGYRTYVAIAIYPNTDTDVTVRISRFGTLRMV